MCLQRRAPHWKCQVLEVGSSSRGREPHGRRGSAVSHAASEAVLLLLCPLAPSSREAPGLHRESPLFLPGVFHEAGSSPGLWPPRWVVGFQDKIWTAEVLIRSSMGARLRPSPQGGWCCPPPDPQAQALQGGPAMAGCLSEQVRLGELRRGP